MQVIATDVISGVPARALHDALPKRPNPGRYLACAGVIIVGALGGCSGEPPPPPRSVATVGAEPEAPGLWKEHRGTLEMDDQPYLAYTAPGEIASQDYRAPGQLTIRCLGNRTEVLVQSIYAI